MPAPPGKQMTATPPRERFSNESRTSKWRITISKTESRGPDNSPRGTDRQKKNTDKQLDKRYSRWRRRRRRRRRRRLGRRRRRRRRKRGIARKREDQKQQGTVVLRIRRHENRCQWSLQLSEYGRSMRMTAAAAQREEYPIETQQQQ